jgi:hypothetical protein
MSLPAGAGACAKCSCPRFIPGGSKFSLIQGEMYYGGSKCECGHKDNVHTVYKPPPAVYGALGTYSDETGWRFASIIGQTSQAEAEEKLIRYCIADLGASDPVVRISGRSVVLAIAKADNGKVGWDSHYMRATAERLAAKNCGDRKRPWVYSIHTQSGDPHNHLSGEPHC